MMDRFGIVAILTTIKTAYPQFSVTSDTADLWLRILKDRDADMVYQATDEYIAANKYPPTIADINQGAIGLEREKATIKGAVQRAGFEFDEEHRKKMWERLNSLPLDAWQEAVQNVRKEYYAAVEQAEREAREREEREKERAC